MTIREWCVAAWDNSRAHGFTEDDFPAKMMLVVSEAAEAVEAWRNSEDYRIPEELADVMLRVFSYCGAHGIDLERAIEEKHMENVARPFKHGGKRL